MGRDLAPHPLMTTDRSDIHGRPAAWSAAAIKCKVQASARREYFRSLQDQPNRTPDGGSRPAQPPGSPVDELKNEGERRR
jgi:hypothetical protein